MPFSDGELRNRLRMYDIDKLIKLCQTLEDASFLDALTVDSSKVIRKIELSYRGMTYKQVIRREILQYIADKWIDFFALLSSVAALVISLIALLSKS